MVEKKKYRATFKCGDCSNVFRKITSNPNLLMAPCPECKKKNRITKFLRAGDGQVTKADLEPGPVYAPSPGPAIIGSNAARAIDATANIVMEDYKMTDMTDRCRPGENMAPKIRPDLQKQADGFFGPKKKGGTIPFDPKRLAQRAMAGQLRDKNYRDPVAALSPRMKPNVEYVNAERKS